MPGFDAVQLAALGAGAVAVFWMLGAYNRLVRLRNRVAAGWMQVDDQLGRRRTALPLLLQALREPLAAEGPTLDAVATAHETLSQAAAAMRGRPLDEPACTAVAAAEAALDAALARLLALLEQHAEVRERDDVAPLRRELRETDQRLAFARQAHDDAVTTYNHAVTEMPTRLLVGWFGFRPAGTLVRRGEASARKG